MVHVRCLLRSLRWSRHQRGFHVQNNSLLVFGSNTDVGKTLVSTGLLKFKPSSRHGLYVKPVQTGEVHDAQFVSRHCQLESLQVRTLYHWELAASPHIAAKGSSNIPDDAEIILRIRTELESFLRRSHDGATMVLIETAGGVLSVRIRHFFRIFFTSVKNPARVLLVHRRNLSPS